MCAAALEFQLLLKISREKNGNVQMSALSLPVSVQGTDVAWRMQTIHLFDIDAVFPDTRILLIWLLSLQAAVKFAQQKYKEALSHYKVSLSLWLAFL